MGFNLDDFKSNFETGARAYLFYVRPVFPNALGFTAQATYLVKSATLPASTLEEIPVNWQGADYKIAGKRTFAPWAITFIVDKQALIQKYFLDWMNNILDPTTNIHGMPGQYFQTQEVWLLGNSGQPILKYQLKYAWPQEVGAVSLDYATNDLATFDVNFSYQYHVTDTALYDVPQSFSR
jgi:hypothetical protein